MKNVSFSYEDVPVLTELSVEFPVGSTTAIVGRSGSGKTTLGNILLRRGEARTALEHYREALRVKPDDPASLNNMAWFLATTRDDSLREGAEALVLAERAARLVSYGNPVLLDTLAACYAEVGRFGQALATAEQAARLALEMGDPELAR